MPGHDPGIWEKPALSCRDPMDGRVKPVKSGRDKNFGQVRIALFGQLAVRVVRLWTLLRRLAGFAAAGALVEAADVAEHLLDKGQLASGRRGGAGRHLDL